MKKIFAISVLLSIFLLVAGCGGSKKETVNDSDVVSDDDIETENNLSDDDILPDGENEKSDEEEEDPPEEQIPLTQECFGKKVLTKETVNVDTRDGNYAWINYTYQIDRYYDENCRIKFESKYRIFPDGILSNYNNKSYKYDEKGNVKQICKRNHEGKLIGECQRFSYEFNDDETIKKMCVGKLEEGREAGCVSYLYDKDGKLKQRIRRSAVKESLPFFRDFSDEKSEYFSDIYDISETVSVSGKTLSEELDMQERVDYFYDDKGNVTEKQRHFIYKELDENGNDVAVYYYGGFIPYYMTPIDMTAKKRIAYDYSDGLPVKSRHDVYAYYMNCSGATWSWHKRKYDKEYFYDKNDRLVRITTSPDERNLVSIDDEREYYPDGSLKRKVTTFDDDGARSTCDWDYHDPKAEERIYDEKGRETEYNKIGYSGGVYETTTRTFYDNRNEIKQETVCNEKCKSYSYTYEHDDLGRITEERKEYDDPVYVNDFETWESIPLKQVDVTYYKYTETGKLKESRAYEISRDYYDENAAECTSKKRIEIYIYDDKDRLVEIRSASSWNEENPDIGSMSVQYAEYDSLDRIIGDNGHIYEYHGNTDVRYKTWLKWGTTVFKYDENGNLVSEKYNKGTQRYSMETEYDEDGYPVSATKEYPNDEYERKETRTYFYEIFQLP